jgi:hypothetical protein
LATNSSGKIRGFNTIQICAHLHLRFIAISTIGIPLPSAGIAAHISRPASLGKLA